ncbi:Hypothetical predicted protein [Pelobates cultripes]|uniref:Uncharacterized protein n=1 Tax=Pelobates cultripes TaxID=61616 RepID=A0AAD1SP30_PELCU|nr:Hypothetical predicted protein [Pelobates cultripes]
MSLLQKRADKGGLGFPDIHKYHKASFLEAAIKFHTPKGTFQWVDMENARAPGGSLVGMLWTPAHTRPNMLHLFNTSITTIKQWDTLHRTQHKLNKFHPRAPITALNSLTPGLTMNSWIKHGIKHIVDTYQDHRLMPFPDLQRKFDLPNASVFQYLQLQSMATYKILTKSDMTSTNLQHLDPLHDQCWLSPTKPKALSLCYNILLNAVAMKTPNYEQQWHTEYDSSPSGNTWLQSLNALKGITNCYSHLEAHKKLVYRWYLTPSKLHKIYPSVSEKCWRCGGAKGTMFHIWWECPVLAPLWGHVKDILELLNITTVTLDPLTCLFLLLPPSLTKPLKQVTILTILAARNLIAQGWKHTHCPTKQQLMDKLHQYYIYEQLSTTSITQSLRFQDTWKTWADIYTPNKRQDKDHATYPSSSSALHPEP